MDVPSDFVTVPLPPDQSADFDKPDAVAPLGLVSSQAAMAIVGVATRPAYGDGAVSHWLGYLAAQQGLDLASARAAMIGPHPGVLADGRQVQDDTELRMYIGIFEDGGRLVIVTGMTTATLVPSFGAALQAAVASVTLTDARGPTADVLP